MSSLRRSRQRSDYGRASLNGILAIIQEAGIDARAIQETPDEVDEWRAWTIQFTIQSGGRTCRVERPRVETDRSKMYREYWGERCVEWVEHAHDVSVEVPSHHWLVNSTGFGSGTFRTADEIAAGVLAVLGKDES